MFTISDLQKSTDLEFYYYVRKKTDFMFLPNSYREQSIFLWHHILSRNNFSEAWQILTSSEKEIIFFVLENYGYAGGEKNSLALEKLEKKFPYLFLHPLGGYFIPLEFFKLFMDKTVFLQKRFLFSLLYQLRNENKDIAAFASRGFSPQAAIHSENRILDMSLSIYIWMSIKQREGVGRNFFLQRKQNKIFLLRAGNGKESIPYIPKKEVNLWEYQRQYFPEEKENMLRLFSLLKDGKKNFYRGLNLLPMPNTRMLRLFSFAYLVPVFPPSKTGEKDFSVEDIGVVCPREAWLHLDKNNFLNNMPN